MKITWFTKTCFRLHLGGKIIVTDPDDAPAGIAPAELVSGADSVIALATNDLADFSATDWSRRRPPSLMNDTVPVPVTLFRFAETGLFVDAPGEGPLILCSQGAQWGRFADGASVVLFGDFADMPDAVARLCDVARPKLVAIATANFDREKLAALAASGAGTPLQIMEPALALEIS